jgi:hypothetical protein
MPWKAIALTAAEISGGVEGELQDAFLAVLTAAGLPKDAVLYTGKSYNPYGFSLYFRRKQRR